MAISRTALGEIFTRHFQADRLALEAWLRLFYQTLRADTMIGYFFENKNLGEIAQKQSEFLWRVAGLAETYSGKAPAMAHLALPPIWTGHFDRRLEILRKLLKERGLADTEIAQWIEIENAFRAAIVTPGRH